MNAMNANTTTVTAIPFNHFPVKRYKFYAFTLSFGYTPIQSCGWVSVCVCVCIKYQNGIQLSFITNNNMSPVLLLKFNVSRPEPHGSRHSNVSCISERARKKKKSSSRSVISPTIAGEKVWCKAQ